MFASRASVITALLVLFEGYRLALRVLVVLMSAHFVTTTISYLKRHRTPVVPKVPEEWPPVTVQLPMRNELYAAERVIRAAAALDYPKDKLEIQILDDSDDQTVEVTKRVAAELRAQGFRVNELRRSDPSGYKAGALLMAFGGSTGEFLAVFDADFVPAPDFLKRTIPYFHDPKVGMVQGRWDHLNRNESWFTALQARVLDGLMVVEQTAKSAAEVPLQFNGTAGVFRKKAIADAGGWTFDSLTEDFDLSLRAVLAGWKLVHLPEVSVPSELPPTLGLFRVQQRRWALGTAQLLRKRLGEVLSAPLPFWSRLALAFQLCRHFGYPLLLIMVATVPLTTFGHVRTLVTYGVVNSIVLGIAIASVAFQHAVAQRALGRSVWPAILLSPLPIALAIGLAPTYTVALYYGLRDRAGAFHRTPKMSRTPKPGEPLYRATRSVLVVPEIAVGLCYGAFAAAAVRADLLPESVFFAFIAGAYLWVGFGSLHVSAVSHPGAGARPEPFAEGSTP
ncbi:MAG TPA: glycosyltransferase family 2 protein [Polyangiaceae bacterium]|nr:glycosyltransferase family 2 protein [Polyangiaceae bacterium]